MARADGSQARPQPRSRSRHRQGRRPASNRPRMLRRPGRGRAQDPFSGELRRRQVLPLLVLHLIAEGPSYGNQLMERIAGMTEGVLSVNPNTMYPLLRRLEEQGLIEGQWEHPERRTRPLLLADQGRPQGTQAPARGRAAVPRLGGPLDRRDRARGLRLMPEVSASCRVPIGPEMATQRGVSLSPLGRFRRGLPARGGTERGLAGRGRESGLAVGPRGPREGHRRRWRSRAAPDRLRHAHLRGAAGGHPDLSRGRGRRWKPGGGDPRLRAHEPEPAEGPDRPPVHPPRPARRPRAHPAPLQG